MKILAIRGSNLASLAGDFALDFTSPPLKGAGLFSIVGETGAGKSTILDALCLGLYGKYPRLRANNQKDKIEILQGESILTDDPRSILKTGTTEGYAEAEVRLGDDHLLARWKVHRAKRKADGALQTAERSLIRLPDGEIIASGKSNVEKEIAARLGLSYDQFRRTVLLAQNEFDLFLRASDKERADLLEKITGTELYSRVSAAAFARHKQTLADCDELKRQHGIAGVLPDEERAALEQQIAEVDAGRQALLVQVDAEQQTVARIERLHEQREWLQQAQDQQAQAAAALQAQAKQQQLFERLQLVLPLAGLMEKCAATKAGEQRLQVELQQRQQQSVQLGARQHDNTVALQKDKRAEDRAAAALAAAEPELAKALQLDHQLATGQQKQQEAKRRLGEQQQKQQKLRAQLDAEQQQLADLQQRDGALEQQLQQNSARLPLIARQQELSRDLERLQDVCKLLQVDEAELQSRSGQLAQVQTQVATDDKWRQDQAGELVDLKQRLQQQTELLAQRQPAALRRRQDDNGAAQLSLLWLERQLEDEQAAQDSIETLNKELAQLADGMQRDGQTLDRRAGEITAVTARGQEVEEQFGRTQAALSKAALLLRAELVEGQPCPVCGACSHPGHGDELADRLLADLKARRKQLADELAALNEAQTAQSHKLQLAQSRQREAQKQLKQAEARLDKLQDKTRQAERRAEASGIAVPVVATAFERLQSVRAISRERQKQAADLQDKLKQVQQLEADVGRARKQAEALEASILAEDENAQARAQQLQQLQAAGAQLEAKVQRQRDSREMLAGQLLSSLSGFDLLHADLLRDPASVARHVQRELVKLDKVQTEQMQLNKSLLALQQAVGVLAERLAQQQVRVAELADEQTQLSDDCSLLAQQRSALLSGQVVEAARGVLQAALEDAREAHKRSVLAVREADTRQEELAVQLAGLGEQLQQAQAQQQQALAARDEGLAQKRVTLAEAEDLLAIPEAERQQLQHKIKALQQAARDADNLLQDRQRQLVALEAEQPDKEPQLLEVRAQLQHSQQRLSELSQQLGRNSNQREQDDKARRQRRKIESRLDKMEADLENWAAVNEAIGAHDGSKFSRFVQGVTLDHLIAFANEQMTILNPRYVIERNPLSSGTQSGGLGLQILDVEMGDEVRSVQSLSGGERFLVSLALALALSRLDGRGSFVDTLLIDEGFGALDARSLDMAVEALERLQSEGRKVGVISHVEALKERISVQVLVEKQGDGRSRVRAVDANPVGGGI